MGLPLGEVSQHEVLEWAQEQAQYLSPTQSHVLLYLCINAWHTTSNHEGRSPGDVLSGRTALSKIQMRTGLGKTAVKDALDALQDAGYIVANHRPGNGKSWISVYWSESADDIRAEVRAGVRALPEVLRREIKTRPKRIVGSSADNIVEFRSAASRHK
jgi:DNA-binding MarR family transcriptional regulator